MQPGQDPLGAPPSFTARRSAASNLPNFELPPPLAQIQNKYQPYGGIHTSSAPAGNSIASVGNLLTPPNTLPSERMTPNSPSVAGGNSHPSMHAYSGPGYWQQGPPSASQYGYPGSSQWIPPRGLFSPTSLNSIVRNGANTPAASDVVSPQGYEMNQLPPFPSSTSLSSPPTVPTMPTQQSLNNSHMGGHAPATSASSHSPISHQDSYPRQPPTPTYYNQQQHSSAPQQQNFHYAAGPGTSQAIPRSMSGQQNRVSPPANDMAHLQSDASQSPQQYPRQYGQYSHHNLHNGVIPNIHSPNSQMAMVGGMQGGMIGSYNGHPGNMQHMYGALQQPQQAPPNPQNDRPFKCDQCAQSFNRNHDLKRHKRIHLAVKPYPCTHCDKSFSRKDALKRHILVKGCGKTRTDKSEDDESPADRSDTMVPIVASAGISPPRASRVGQVEA